MNLSGNTVRITGGSSGIGLELARAFAARGNTVLITGNDPQHLDAALQSIPAARAFQSDVANPTAIKQLSESVLRAFPSLNLLVNNAGIFVVNALGNVLLPNRLRTGIRLSRERQLRSPTDLQRCIDVRMGT